MKKLLVIGIMLAFGLSACDMFDAVALDPTEDWIYVMAKTELGRDGKEYSKFLVNGQIVCGQEVYTRSPVFEEAINSNLTTRVVDIPAFDMSVHEVWIETTMPWWSLEDLNHHIFTSFGSADWMDDYTTISGIPYYADVTYKTVGYERVATYSYDGDDLFEVRWPVSKEIPKIDPFGLFTKYGIKIYDIMPSYSGVVKIKRLVENFDDVIGFGIQEDVDITFHVKADGFITEVPRYTGFKVSFKGLDDEQYAEYIVNEAADYFYTVNEAPVNAIPFTNVEVGDDWHSWLYPLVCNVGYTFLFGGETIKVVKWTGNVGDPAPDAGLDGWYFTFVEDGDVVTITATLEFDGATADVVFTRTISIP